MKRLDRNFYEQDAVTLAQLLLGKVLVINKEGIITRSRIVETEAYCGVVDKAAHSYKNRRTKRTEIMYHEGGHVYIYFIYGMYYLLNVVANKKDIPEGVLIRGVRELNNKGKLLDGPGKLTRALDIDKRFYGVDLTNDKDIYIIDDGYHIQEIIMTERINIDYAEEDKHRLWRFLIKE